MSGTATICSAANSSGVLHGIRASELGAGRTSILTRNVNLEEGISRFCQLWQTAAILRGSIRPSTKHMSPLFQHRFIANILQRVYPTKWRPGPLMQFFSDHFPIVHENSEDAPSHALWDPAPPFLGPCNPSCFNGCIPPDI